VRIDFSRPGKPTDSSYVETFNGSLRDECRNVHWFESLGQANPACLCCTRCATAASSVLLFEQRELRDLLRLLRQLIA
jgi:transposase InsO family protein